MREVITLGSLFDGIGGFPSVPLFRELRRYGRRKWMRRALR